MLVRKWVMLFILDMLFHRYLDNNLIDKLESGDFCELSLLTELHMESNLLTEATIPEGAFNCTRALQIL